MKRFKFKLETYLKLKKLEEQNKMADLATVVGKIEAQRSEVTNYFSESNRLLSEEAQKIRQGEFDIKYTKDLQNYFYLLERRRRVAERTIESLGEELADKQALANAARKKRRVIEILKENIKKEHQKAVDDEESKNLDEFNQVRQRIGRSLLGTKSLY